MTHTKMIVPDEVVIAALLKDAKKFKSKWELHTNEPTRSKPNVVFLKRTLSNVVKVNKDRMREPPKMERYEQDMHDSANEQRRDESDSKESSSSSSRRDHSGSRRPKKLKNCSKSKYRSRESRHSSSRKSSKRKRDISRSKKSPKR